MPPRFVCDSMLGKLARYLRMVGLDCLYRRDWNSQELIQISKREKRIVLTRNKTLIARKDLRNYYFIDQDQPQEQLKNIIAAFSLHRFEPGRLCPICNEVLIDAPANEVKKRVWPFVKKKYRDFKMCVNCNRIYWSGSHIKSFLRELLNRDRVREPV